jgi:D-arabinitol dehydrogenase (NADP+)
VGKIVKMGKNVKGFEMGDRCVADVSITCGNCFFCRRGESLFCENFEAKGVAVAGGFAEYIT